MMKNNVLNALHLSEVSYVGYNAFDMSELWESLERSF